jgi:hypothetical protein
MYMNLTEATPNHYGNDVGILVTETAHIGTPN